MASHEVTEASHYRDIQQYLPDTGQSTPHTVTRRSPITHTHFRDQGFFCELARKTKLLASSQAREETVSQGVQISPILQQPPGNSDRPTAPRGSVILLGVTVGGFPSQPARQLTNLEPTNETNETLLPLSHRALASDRTHGSQAT